MALATDSLYTRIPDVPDEVLEQRASSEEHESLGQEHDDASQSLKHLYLVLPIAFFSSMGMSATSATTIFAYETLLCEDASNCQGEEKKKYAATIAFSVTIANICAILVLGILPFLPRRNPKTPLLFWLVCRSLSIGLLAVGVRQNSVLIALVGRVFEGFATDNILQLALNTVYVSAAQPSQVSRLFGVSLALYMLGQALSPSIAGAFSDFTMSFAFAIGIFALCTVYLQMLPQFKRPQEIKEFTGAESKQNIATRVAGAIARSLVEPLRTLLIDPLIWGPGMALFLFLAAISYIYPALMVFAAMRFGFTGKENGWIISTAATSSSVYLLLVHFVWPKLWPRLRQKEQNDDSEPNSAVAFGGNFWHAMASLSLLVVAIPIVGFTRRSWQLFPLVAVASMGLTAPSFIKSYAVDLAADAPRTLTALALAETCGALLSPILLGSAQNTLKEGLVFIVSSALVAGAMLLFALGASAARLLGRSPTGPDRLA
ncbi:major facilitator superfamily domain-containing protein [Lophiotrema nucula]|uniref:Major facilitator superfamily domain-containing protein n=1 Tax=Lophiotrema nucula TaxID=690887 RepID=A0A6A5YGH0_9PLEO|nr:major facilitator superfamily domain-containing protein [Lophiotrema nucula]